MANVITKGFHQMMSEASAVVETVSVQTARRLFGDGDTVFVDVRETAELDAQGTIPGAVSAPRGFLEFIADPAGPMHNDVFASGRRLVLFCGTGGRSTLAVKTLSEMGLTNLATMAGGFEAWKSAGGPTAPRA